MREQGYYVHLISETELIDNEEDIEKLSEEIKTNVKDMKIYPQEGSIKDMGEYVIIKIGPSLWEK